MGDLYHSALKQGALVPGDVSPMARYERGGCVVVQSDLIKDRLAPEFSVCDVFYADPPWAAGFKVFDERAGVAFRRSYGIFVDRMAELIRNDGRPHYLVIGANLRNKLPEPAGSSAIKLNGNAAQLVWWHDTYEGPTDEASNVIRHLATRYNVMGDWCCGYGRSLLTFLDGGGKGVVGADHNGKCVAVVAGLLENRFNQITE